jgi:hypothetical protein
VNLKNLQIMQIKVLRERNMKKRVILNCKLLVLNKMLQKSNLFTFIASQIPSRRKTQFSAFLQPFFVTINCESMQRNPTKVFLFY